MKRAGRVKIFSITRFLVSVVLGFLLPLSYALLRIKLFGSELHTWLDMPLRWPFHLWTAILGLPNDDLAVTVVILCIVSNVLLYGAISYFALLAFAIARRKPEELPAPPQPELNHSSV
jgi:hypothetical protein